MLSRLVRTSAIALGILGATSSGCAQVDLPPPAVPPPAAPPPPPATVVVPVAAPAPPPDPNAFDPSRIQLVLDDPRLAPVKAEVDREAYARAAQELTAILASAQPSPEDKRAWLYQLGRLRALGGDPAGAARAFEDSAATPWALSDYARLQAAQWLVGIGKHDAAIAAARAISADPPLAGAVDLVMADALLGKGDTTGAAARFRAYLAREKHPPQWANVALRFAGALLQRPSEAHAEEAVRLARRVLYEAPASAGNASDIEKQGLATLPSKKRKAFEHPTADEQLAKAKGLAGLAQAREAVLVTDKLVKLPKAKKAGEFACEVFLTRGEALSKMKKKRPEAADAYKDAIDRCEGQPRRVDALFAGGKASAQAGRHLEAIARYALLEKEFPAHRFADDARIKGARAALDAGDDARFDSMLSRIADDYPGGDMATDGLFHLALYKIGKSNWAGAIPVLERALALSPHEHAYFDAGRLPYFIARAHLATGQPEKAAAELASVVRDYPLSYYMALAFARLAERDPAGADRAVAEAVAREPAGTFTIPKGPWLDDPTFVRAVELVRQGDAKLARVELDRLGVSARTAPREIMWASAFMLARAGATTQSHGLLRSGANARQPKVGELVDWLDHYPAGRWRAAWEVAYPRPWSGIVAAESKRSGLPEAWAYAIMREESAFEARVVSPANAFGLMQLIVPTAKHMAQPLGLPWDEDSLKRPEVNIALGCRYLTVLRGQFADNPLLAIPGYNAGGGAPKKWVSERPGDDFDLWVERIPYEETRFYTKRVIGSMAAYEFLYARDQPSEALRTPRAASPSALAALSATP